MLVQNGGPAFRLRKETGVAGTVGSFAFATLTTPALDPATWYLVAATFDTTNGEKVYLFDALTRTLIGSATNANTTPNVGATCNATIGAWTGGGGLAGENNSFLGTIDDFRIYNSALTQAQIAAVPEPSPIALSILAIGSAVLAKRIRRRAI